MARSDKYKKVSNQEVDLLPFMNLLAILIPALLMSTEYLKISTVAVQSPQIGPKETSQTEKDPDEKPPLNLTLAISSNGIYIKSSAEKTPEEQAAALANPGPDVPKVTVKVYMGRTETGKTVEAARVWSRDGRKYLLGVKEVVKPDDGTEDKLEVATATYKKAGTLTTKEELDYDYPLLHEKLRAIKKNYEEEKQVIISADPNIDFTTLIRTMDASRKYTDDEKKEQPLFPHVILSAGIV
jgi:biopolymer transport protein ExbD